jgi:hypothetical protein
VVVSEDNYCSVRASESNAAGDGALPTSPATPLAQTCLLNEFRRLDAEAAARKLRIAPQRRAAMKRYWALRKASDLRGVA